MTSQPRKPASGSMASAMPDWLKIFVALLWGLVVLAAGLFSGISLEARILANSKSQALSTDYPPGSSIPPTSERNAILPGSTLPLESTPLQSPSSSELTPTSAETSTPTPSEVPYPYPLPGNNTEMGKEPVETEGVGADLRPASSSTPTFAFPTSQPLNYTAVPLELPAFPNECIPERVVVVLIDGLRADAVFEKHALPVMEGLARAGVYDWHAQSIPPALTNPALASIFSALTPAHHGMRSDLETDYPFPYLQVKSIFQYIKGQEPQAFNILLAGKKRMQVFNQPGAIDLFEYHRTSALVAQAAVEFIEARDFKIAFFHLPDPDNAGHDYSFESQQYLQAVRAQNPLLENIFNAMRDQGIYDSSLIIVTSDYGGAGMSHSDSSPLDLTIPWVMVGKCIRQGFDLQSHSLQVNILDITPTILYTLGMAVPSDLDGKPILDAFELPLAGVDSWQPQ